MQYDAQIDLHSKSTLGEYAGSAVLAWAGLSPERAVDYTIFNDQDLLDFNAIADKVDEEDDNQNYQRLEDQSPLPIEHPTGGANAQNVETGNDS